MRRLLRLHEARRGAFDQDAWDIGAKVHGFCAGVTLELVCPEDTEISDVHGALDAVYVAAFEKHFNGKGVTLGEDMDLARDMTTGFADGWYGRWRRQLAERVIGNAIGRQIAIGEDRSSDGYRAGQYGAAAGQAGLALASGEIPEMVMHVVDNKVNKFMDEACDRWVGGSW